MNESTNKSTMSDEVESQELEAAPVEQSPKGVDRPMFCIKCGVKNPGDANFCKQCGHRMERSTSRPLSEEEFAQPADPNDTVGKLLVTAYKHYEIQNLDAALRACKEALLIRPDNTDVHSLMSTLYEKQDDVPNAIIEREKVLELNPGSIADREKLDELKDGKPMSRAGKINFVRPVAGTSFWDRPGSNALVVILLMIAVLGVGAWAIISKTNSNEKAAANNANRTSVPLNTTGTIQGPQQTAVASNQFFTTGTTNRNLAGQQNGQPVTNPNNVVDNRAANPNNPQTNRSPARPRADVEPLGSREVGVAPVNPPTSDPNNLRTARNGGNTVHLPEGTGDGANPGAPTNPAPGSGAPGITPGGSNGQRPGKIEIIVAPGNGTAGGGNVNTRPPASDNSSNMSSSENRREGQKQQLAGQYKKAVTYYTRALDGAGDDAAPIHYQIGLCHQRLDENAAAIEHYNSAIKSYKEMIAAGKNVEAATRGIKASESGIKVCQ